MGVSTITIRQGQEDLAVVQYCSPLSVARAKQALQGQDTSWTGVLQEEGSLRRVGGDQQLKPGLSYILTLQHHAGWARLPKNLQAASPDAEASKYAAYSPAYLQSEAGKQQLESASDFSLPTGVSLMGMPRYGRQLYVRRSYLKLRSILAQLVQDADLSGVKSVLVSGTPGIGKSFCALY
ncbi:TPA: hypothetical protein ACH3X3_005503 [Trebouxia sp. C0006]